MRKPQLFKISLSQEISLMSKLQVWGFFLGLLCTHHGFASYLDQWKQTNPVAYSGRIYDGTFADGYFYLVGENGEITRSDDGVYWNTVLEPQLNRLFRGIDYENGVISAVGFDGLFAFSIDGEDWQVSRIQLEEDSTDLSLFLLDIESGNDQLIAVGFVGSSWDDPSYSVAYKSSDGKNWEELPIRGEGRFMSVAFGANRFVISDKNGVFYSQGEEWLYQRLTEEESDSYVKYLGFADGIFYLWEDFDSQYTIGYSRYQDPSTPVRVDFYSEDGVNWELTTPNRIRHIPGGNRWWSPSRDSYGLSTEYGTVYYLDLVLRRFESDWFANTEIDYDLTVRKRYHTSDTLANPIKLLYGNNKFLLIGYGVLASFSEEDQKMLDAVVDEPSLDVSDMAIFDDKIWYVGREKWGYSENGVEWTEKRWSGYGWPQAGGIDAVGDVLLFRNRQGYFIQDNIYENIWRPNFLDRNTRREFINGSVVHFLDKYLIFNSNTNNYLESPDCINWNSTPIELPMELYPRKAVVGNDRIILLAQNGRRFVSEDLIHWSEVFISQIKTPQSIVFFEGYFYLSDGQGIWRSVNGSNWLKMDYSNSSNPFVDTQISRFELAGKFLCGIPPKAILEKTQNHIYISVDGENFRRVWLNDSIKFNTDYSLYNGLNYFNGRIWGHEFRKVIISPPLDIVPNQILPNGAKKSDWFGIYVDDLYPMVRHISLGYLKTGIDFDTGEFFLESEQFGRFHVLSPFQEDALYLYSLDFDSVYFVAKYNDDLTRTAEADFYDHLDNCWTDSIEPDSGDYQSAQSYLEAAVDNVRARRNQTVQYAELKDHTAAHQFLSECKLFHNACLRNAQRTKDRLEVAIPSDKGAHLQVIEDKLNEATTLMNEAQNAYDEMSKG